MDSFLITSVHLSIAENFLPTIRLSGKFLPSFHPFFHIWEDDLKIWKVEYFSFNWSDLTQIWNLSKYDQIRVYKDIKWRRPQNMKSGIYQQPLVWSYSNFKLKLWVQIRVYKGIKWRQPPVEDDLKIRKVEYLSNQWSDLTQIWNLS
jgi:hypothetical protein